MKKTMVLAFLMLIALHGWLNANPPGDALPSNLTELSLDQLMQIKIPTVSGASGFEQKTTQAPSSITIITSDEIRKYGYRTFGEIFRSIRGFYTTSDRNYTYLGVRGFSRPGDFNSRILTLIDGHRLNDNVYDSSYFGYDFILDLDLIERIEIIRGPSSSLYGANAFFAVINVITRRGRDLKGAEASGAAGSFYSYNGRLTYGNQYENGLEAVASGSYVRSKGDQHLFYKEFDDPSSNYGVAKDCDREQAYSFFSTASFKGFTLQGAYVSREKWIPTGSYGVDFNDPFNRTRDNRGYLDLKYEHTFSNELDVAGRLYYDNYYYEGVTSTVQLRVLTRLGGNGGEERSNLARPYSSTIRSLSAGN